MKAEGVGALRLRSGQSNLAASYTNMDKDFDTMYMEELPQWKRELPSVQHKLFNDLLSLLVEYYKEHVRRDIDTGRLNPADSWVMLRGFLMAAMQTYASICILVVENRPKRLLLQAAILNRSLFESFATVLALTEDLVPRTRMLIMDYYRTLALIYLHRTGRFGADPKWAEFLEVYRKYVDAMALELGIPPQLAQEPRKIKEWPTPGLMFGKPQNGIAPFVSGTRLAVLQETYRFHYSGLSAQAHSRMAAVAQAALVDDPSLQWNPGYGESDVIVTAILFIACILSEVESVGSYAHHPKLAELWAYLRDTHDEPKELWHLRYEELSNRTKGI